LLYPTQEARRKQSLGKPPQVPRDQTSASGQIKMTVFRRLEPWADEKDEKKCLAGY